MSKYKHSLEEVQKFLNMMARRYGRCNPQLIKDLQSAATLFVLEKLARGEGVRLTQIKDKMKDERTKVLSQVHYWHKGKKRRGAPQQQHIDGWDATAVKTSRCPSADAQ